jgi:hypothetical protein
MQVIPLPPVLVPGAVPQEAVTRVLPQIQAQSSAPIIQRAVDPSRKSDRGNKARSNTDRGKGGGGKGDRGSTVNIRV